MFPIGDDNSSRRIVPVVTYALIALNVLFFFIELNGGEPFIRQWSVVPSRLVADPAGISQPYSPQCSCMLVGYTCLGTCSTFGYLATM